MADALPDHEVLERVFTTEPNAVLKRLPNNIARRRAEEHSKIAADYAHEAREKPADRPEP